MKDIGQGVFQLELLEEWAIYNVFNKNLLTQYRKSQFKRQYIDSAPPSDIINEEEESQKIRMWYIIFGLLESL